MRRNASLFLLSWVLLLLSTRGQASPARPRPEAPGQASPARPRSVASARSFSLAEANRFAQRRSWDARIARAATQEARARRSATRMLWFPQLKITANALLWNSDLPFEIPPMDTSTIQMPDGCELFSAYSDCLNAFMQAFDLGKIREQFTMQATVRIAQPLTPLYAIFQANRVSRLAVQMAKQGEKKTADQIRFEVTQAYLQVYQAEAYDRIMREAEALVQAHETRVRALLKEDVVRRAELLKVRVKHAEVQQGRLRARAAVSLARSNLARLLGLPIQARLHLTERFADPPPRFPLTLETCIRRAQRQRPEIRMTRIGQEQALAGRRAKRWGLVPTIAAVAQFEANYGMGTIMPKTAVFVGAVLEWDFAWGKRWLDADVLTAKLNQARLLERKARAGIPLEVKKHFLDLQVARQSLHVARTQVAAAAESHRIQVKRYELHAGSSTDVLDAQMELTRARVSYSSSLYQYYIARAALARAMGGRP